MADKRGDVKRETFDLSALKSRISKLERSSHSTECSDCDHEGEHEYLLEYPLDQRRIIRALEVFQEKRGFLEAEFRTEVMELEKKYLLKYHPLYEERAKLINGDRQPTEEEYAGMPESTVAEVDDKGEPIVEDGRGLAGFWLKALQNHPELSQLIFEADEPALRTLKDVRVDFLESSPGFRLNFVFGPNDFFTNSILSKEYYLENPTTADCDQLAYDHAVGTTVEWKEGKNLCFKTVTKTQRQKNGKGTRVVRREEYCDSFFHFFNPPVLPEHENNADEEDSDAADPDELEEQLQFDYEVGDIIKSHIIPSAVDWFTGKALEYDDYSDGDYDSEECDDEDEDDEEDEESEEEHAHPKASRRHVSGAPKSNPNPQEQQQCKQQ